jgi:hypothetical protein
MASFSSPLVLQAGAAIRLPAALQSGSGPTIDVRPVASVFPPQPPREEPQARQTRQDLAENRGRTRRAHGSFGQTQLRHPQASSFAPGAFATSPFLAQILGQDLGPAGNVVALHRDGPNLSSDAYRRAGGEPVIYSEEPRILRIAV